MLRFPSLEDYILAFKRNPLVFLTGLVGGLGAGILIGSFWSTASRDIMSQRYELELTQAHEAIHGQADKLEKAQADITALGDSLRAASASAEREAALKDQLVQAQTAHEADAAKIMALGDRLKAANDQIAQAQTVHEADTAKMAQQQAEIDKFTAAAKRPGMVAFTPPPPPPSPLPEESLGLLGSIFRHADLTVEVLAKAYDVSVGVMQYRLDILLKRNFVSRLDTQGRRKVRRMRRPPRVGLTSWSMVMPTSNEVQRISSSGGLWPTARSASRAFLAAFHSHTQDHAQIFGSYTK